MVDYIDLIGFPFEYGGRGSSGYDCYGLLMELYRRMGIEIPDLKSPPEMKMVAGMMAKEKLNWVKCEIEPGATILFRIKGYGSHVGMALGGNRFVHTWEGTNGVSTDRVSLWMKRIEGVYKYVI